MPVKARSEDFMAQRVKVLISVLLLFSSLSGFSQTPTGTAKAEQKTIYLFSGLGADSSLFRNLHLPGYHKVYITWVPSSSDETIEQYAARIKSQITVENPYIIGVSFGGIVAVEVSKLVNVEKMVLISSATTKDELSKFQFFFMRLGLYRLVPRFLLQRMNFITYSYFGARTKMDKDALKQLLQGTDIYFFRWALKSISHWENKQPPEHTIQVHGTADRVISSKRVHPDYRIKGGGHLMVFNKADTISKIIMHYFHSKADTIPNSIPEQGPAGF
ncbi:alpha/beta hydrolase [Chitinophaga varians]|uniref:alpha/beta hydrolase n=1 Tax=Chitinophaga varians TaxID=2202339 RepID=UPI00165F5CB8|nr:alpha/beta hydrolase [Chitinophaga varians]MBC9914796.1 alpha/beta hydrolase [Chitinophaga varians]